MSEDRKSLPYLAGRLDGIQKAIAVLSASDSTVADSRNDDIEHCVDKICVILCDMFAEKPILRRSLWRLFAINKSKLLPPEYESPERWTTVEEVVAALGLEDSLMLMLYDSRDIDLVTVMKDLGDSDWHLADTSPV